MEVLTVKELGLTSEISVEMIMNEYDFNMEQAKMLFESVWIYTFGIGTLCVIRMCGFQEKKVSKCLELGFKVRLCDQVKRRKMIWILNCFTKSKGRDFL